MTPVPFLTHTVALILSFLLPHFTSWLLFHRGRGMPRGAPRGAMRGGAPRGGLGRGSAPRGAPSGRGGPPSAPARGGSAPRSRPPTAGAPRMLPSAAMSHQQHQVPPSASQPKAEAYEDYVSILNRFLIFHRLSCTGLLLIAAWVVTHVTLPDLC